MKKKTCCFSSFYCLLFPFHDRKSMFAVLHSDINALKSGLLHLTGQTYCKQSRSAKVKDGIINLILRNYFVDRYTYPSSKLVPCSLFNNIVVKNFNNSYLELVMPPSE